MKKSKIYVAILILLTIFMIITACGDKGEKKDTADYSKTEGTWYFDGAAEAAKLVMDGKGGIESYFSDGTLEFKGYIEMVMGSDGIARYNAYTEEGGSIFFFQFDTDGQISLGLAKVIIYKKLAN
ncbi:MAG: hypothetical protein GX628_04080 [Clostridiales bacterium]|nr:hypothetical protein [Clostridiales bacterium]